MNTLTCDRLEEAVIRALERLAFLSVWPAETDEQEPCTHHMQVCYSGDGESGSVVLSASHAFLTELTAGLLGVEEDKVDVDGDGDDVLGELANILAGQVIGLLGGDERPIRLGLPEKLAHAGQSARPTLESWLRSERGVFHVAVTSRV